MPKRANKAQPKRGTCTATSKSGNKCHRPAYVLESGEALPTCYFHTKAGTCAEVDQKRHEAATKGGKVTRYKTTLDVDKSAVRDASDVSKVLATTLEGLGQGDLDPRQATAIATVTNALMKSLELELEVTRLAELEARLGIGDGKVSTVVDEATAGPWINQADMERR